MQGNGRGKRAQVMSRYETAECYVQIGGLVDVYYNHKTKISDVVLINLPQSHTRACFDHHVEFVPEIRKEVNVGFLMFKDLGVSLSDVHAVATKFGLRTMVFPEALSLSSSKNKTGITMVFDWFFRQAKKHGMIPKKALFKDGQFQLPVLSSSVFLNCICKHHMSPRLDFKAADLNKISLTPVGDNFNVGRQIFPCVMNS